MAQQEPLEGVFCRLLLAERLLHLALRQLKAGTVRGAGAFSRSQHLARGGQIAHGQQNVGLQARAPASSKMLSG